MDKTLTDVISYITIIGWIVAFIATANKSESKLALNQGLTLGIIGTICAFVCWIPIVNLLAGLVALVCFVFSIWCIVNALNGVDKGLPVIGDIVLLKNI